MGGSMTPRVRLCPAETPRVLQTRPRNNESPSQIPYSRGTGKIFISSLALAQAAALFPRGEPLDGLKSHFQSTRGDTAATTLGGREVLGSSAGGSGGARKN